MDTYIDLSEYTWQSLLVCLLFKWYSSHSYKCNPCIREQQFSESLWLLKEKAGGKINGCIHSIQYSYILYPEQNIISVTLLHGQCQNALHFVTVKLNREEKYIIKFIILCAKITSWLTPYMLNAQRMQLSYYLIVTQKYKAFIKNKSFYIFRKVTFHVY